MDITPAVNVNRFEQLATGEIFLFELEGRRDAALKAFDPANGDKFIVPLGQSYSVDEGPARLLKWEGITVVSFGKQFTVRLPTEAGGWMMQEPSQDVLTLAAGGGETYIRANCSSQSNKFQRCWVRFSDGHITYGGLPAILAYAVRWEIVIPDGPLNPRTVVAQC